MSETRSYPTAAAERYDRSLSRSRHTKPLPEGTPVPRPTSEWPPENIILLEKYRDWLTQGGYATVVINQHRVPMAGHVLGFALKPHHQVNFRTDFEAPMRYVEAKGVSDSWLTNCRRSLDYFREFLREIRGTAVFHRPKTPDFSRYQAGLPADLVSKLTRYHNLCRANWRPSQIERRSGQFWQKYTVIWRWLFQHGRIETITDITRNHLHQFVDELLVAGYKPSTINCHLHNFQSTLRFLAQQGEAVPAGLLTFRGLKKPNSLPRFLTQAEIRTLLTYFEQQMATAETIYGQDMSRFDHTVFVLMWQTGLRVGEVEALQVEDMDLSGRKAIVRAGKGLADRVVYLTDRAIAAVKNYLTVRGTASRTNHFFLHRHKPLTPYLIYNRLKIAGKKTGIKVTPHMLRHTFATELVNAGCPMPTIQQLLGHERLQTTLIYARVHDATVASDYLKAMGQIEGEMVEIPTLHQAVEEWLDGFPTGTAIQDEKLSQLRQILVTWEG